MRSARARVVAASLLLAAAARAQLTDLQPGRNFPTATAAFGLNRSSEIDAGDVDNDGDLDVAVANGGDFGNEPDRLFINQGGAQGGLVGSFVERTAEQWNPVSDTSRDVEFVDLENDGDLDILIANETTGILSAGGVTRFYVNQGGAQAGTIGLFVEGTNSAWGTLVSVPSGQQVFGGNQGPWRDFSCDCDFGDLDDDGDLDLFHSSYGPAMNGTRPSRVFLNDGAGVFHELFPWADPSADINTHTNDMDLLDLEGDYDLDVVLSSRNSQGRIYQSNMHGPLAGSTTPYTDTTLQGFQQQGISSSASVNLEVEYADVDGDDDFDVWMLNWNGNTDRVMRNDGADASGYVRFNQQDAWIKGDPIQDELEVDFGDYDEDGDLDALVANFSGSSYLYQSGLAQGLDPVTQGLFHRAGGGTGSLAAAFPELPSGDSNTTPDADWFDADNDGDDDYAKGNKANQQNDLVINALGVPDTHAPFFFRAEEAGPQANGVDVIVHAQIRDNHSWHLMNFFDAEIAWCVDGVEQAPLAMRPQGSMQYRGVISAQTDATIRYHFEVTDLAGNTGVSNEFVYMQGAGFDPWTDLGGGIAGVVGTPELSGTGSLIAGEPASLELGGAATSAQAVLFVALGPASGAPFKGGTLIAFPIAALIPLATDGSGEISLPFAALELPCGTELVLQLGVADTAAVKGVALSNGLSGLVP